MGEARFAKQGLHRGPYQPALWWIAAITTATALIPIFMGAWTTTRDAGMAFPDWPSSDGHNMVLYPWLQSAGDKFLEHGHRLGGVLIGLVSLVLAGAFLRREPRGWVRGLATGVLACVIVQGLLGGQRVVLNERGLAFVHGSFAVLVFGLMGLVTTVSSRGWFEAKRADAPQNLPLLFWVAVVTVPAIFLQYVLGGLVRHHGMALYEHALFASVVFLLAVFLAGGAVLGGSRWLRWPGVALGLATFCQVLLGVGAWVTKYGFGDYVAVLHSPVQVFFRTAHVLTGMMVFLSAVVVLVRLCRFAALNRQGRTMEAAGSQPLSGLERAMGGAG